MSALSSDKIHKYELLAGEDILPSNNQQQIIEQARFTYSAKAFEKQIKTIEDQGKKQVDALESLKPKNKENLLRINPIIGQKVQLYLMILLAKENK